MRQSQPRSGTEEAANASSSPSRSARDLPPSIPAGLEAGQGGQAPGPAREPSGPAGQREPRALEEAERQDAAQRVARRWASSGSGERYGTRRFRSKRAHDRDPALLRSLLAGCPLPELPVLDAPSGAGRLGPMLRSLDRPVVSLDVSASMLGEVAPAGRGRLQGSALALPFQDASFGLVVCCRLLHHLGIQEEREQLLGELGRVSTRWVALSYWDTASWHAWRRRRGWRRGHDRRVAIAASTLEATAKAAGLRLVARRFSLRFVSPQSWALFERVGTRP